MNLLELAQERGLQPKWVAGTEGGEYHSPCPDCGGNDRFVIQPFKTMTKCLGRYWCRKCEKGGDAIQFGIDYLELKYPEAAAKVGAQINESAASTHLRKFSKSNIPSRSPIKKVSDKWQSSAALFVEKAHNALLQQAHLLAYLNVRGITLEAVKENRIGYNREYKKIDGTNWGIEENDKNRPPVIHLSKGIVIPCTDQGNVIRIKIRRTDWTANDKLPKYMAISGSMNGLSIIGDKTNKVVVVVESELDAYAVHHATNDFICAIAVGGCKKEPDWTTKYLATNAKVLLICHDNDEAGQNMFDKWHRLYPHAKAYPTPTGKDIGEAIQQGLELRAWLIEALPQQLQIDLGLAAIVEWNPKDKVLIDSIYAYIEQQRVNPNDYVPFDRGMLQEIDLGPNSPRARSGELQEILFQWKQSIEVE